MADASRAKARLCHAIAVLPVLIVVAGQGRALGAPSSSASPSAAEIQAGRQQRSTFMLTTDMPATARYARDECTKEDEPAIVAKARADGDIMTPDAGDTCIAAMVRQARDGALLGPYQDVLEDRTGNRPVAANREELLQNLSGMLTAQGDAPTSTAVGLPQRIADTIRAGGRQIDLGDGHRLEVTPGLALDDGFTLAYAEGPNARPLHVTDMAKLKAATEVCVAQNGDDRVCFTAGYVQGAAAYAAAHHLATTAP